MHCFLQMAKMSCPCPYRMLEFFCFGAHEKKSTSIQDGRSCCSTFHKSKKKHENKHVLEMRSQCSETDTVSDLFWCTNLFPVCAGNESREGAWVKLCTHCAGCGIRGAWAPTHHSCSTPTFRHGARDIKYSSQLQFEQTLANFSAMCCGDKRWASASVFKNHLTPRGLCSARFEMNDGRSLLATERHAGRS